MASLMLLWNALVYLLSTVVGRQVHRLEHSHYLIMFPFSLMLLDLINPTTLAFQWRLRLTPSNSQHLAREK